MEFDTLIVVDTHVLIWLLNGNDRLGKVEREQLDATARGSRILVSAITSWEIAMLVEKGRLSLGRDVGEWIASAFALPGIQLAPIEPSIAIDSVRLPGKLHGDPADRIIIATARYSSAPLMTADEAILDYGDAGHLGVLSAEK